MIKFTAIDRESQYIQAETSLEYDLKLLLDSGEFVCGKYCLKLEQEIVRRLSCFTKKPLYCVGLSSGTDCIRLCLEYKKRWYHLPKIIPTAPLTFFATTEAILAAGYQPYFTDINLKNYQITPDNSAVIVGLHGSPIFNYEGYDFLINDNCQLGLDHYCDNAWASCYSTFPSKVTGGCEDGGFVVTSDKDLAEWLKLARYHGIDFTKDRRKCNVASGSFRLNEINSLFVLKRLELYGGFQDSRHIHAKQYCSLLDISYNPYHYYHIFNVFVKNRELLCNILDQHKVQWGMHYPYSVPQQMKFSGYRNILKVDLPNTEWFTEHCLSLPMHPFLTKDDVSRICDIVKPYIIKENV